MRKRRITCPETAYLEDIEYEEDPVTGQISRILSCTGSAHPEPGTCGITCAKRLNERLAHLPPAAPGDEPGRQPCCCKPGTQPVRLIALTGGPGAGKTAVLEMVRRLFCRHVAVLPEAASIIYGGGFPRGSGKIERKAGQCAIYHVQRQLERIPIESGNALLAICDRGSVDGLAYWPDSEESYWRDVGSTLDFELARYSAVIHLRTPNHSNGYNHQNPLRTESAEEAARIDARILELWSQHPRRTVIDSSKQFMDKVKEALAAIRTELDYTSILSPAAGRATDGNPRADSSS